MNDIASVTIVFSREPGGPRVEIAHVVSWVEALLYGSKPEGFNSLRYSTARVSSAELIGTEK